MREFIVTCKERAKMMATVPERQRYILDDVDTYSLVDLVGAANGNLLPQLRAIAHRFLTHIMKCEVTYMYRYIYICIT